MSVFKDVANFFANIFRSSAEKAWAHLHDDIQNQTLTMAGLTQVIKTSTGTAYSDFIAKASVETGLPADAINGTVKAIGKDLGITQEKEEEIYSAIQAKATAIQTDNGWNALWQDVMKFGANYITNGKLDWATLSLGVAQIGYEKFLKKKAV